MSRLFKLKARYYLILFILMVIVDVLLCIYAFYSTNKTLNIVLLVVSFLLTGGFFDLFVQKLFDKKRRNEMFKQKIYDFDGIENMLSNFKDYTERTLPYGNVYSKVCGVCLYKLTIINDINEYHSFDPEKHEMVETPGIKKAKSMVGIEIFASYDDKLIESIPNYTITTERVMYTAFYLKDDKLVETNHLEPNKNVVDDYNELLKMVGARDEESATL